MPPVAPMLAKPAAAIPPGQFYEPKWDGFRSIVFRDGDEVEIGSRKERPMTRYFPEVVDAVRRSFPPRAVIDGEIVVAGDGGLDFWALQQRIHPAASRVAMLATATPASFIAFDLLALGNHDFAGEPFSRRRAALERALAHAAPPIHVTPITRDEQIARAWFERFEGAGLDGLIAKRPDVAYEPGKRVMTKIKHVRTAECVVAGYRIHKSVPDAIGSLLLGLYRDEAAPPSQWGDHMRGLTPVGVIGAFPLARRRDLFAELQPLVVDVADHPWSWAADMGQAPEGGSRWNPGRTCPSCRCGRSASSRCATTTSRARGSGTRRSSCAGGPTATPPPAVTPSSSSRQRSTWPTSSPGGWRTARDVTRRATPGAATSAEPRHGLTGRAALHWS
jgi:ATP-dependent DNA ligase